MHLSTFILMIQQTSGILFSDLNVWFRYQMLNSCCFCLIRSKWLTNTGQPSTSSFKLLLSLKKKKILTWKVTNKIRLKKEKQANEHKEVTLSRAVLNSLNVLCWAELPTKALNMWGPKGHQIKYTKGPFVIESSLFCPTLSKPKLRDPEVCNKERRKALFEKQEDHRYQ